MDQDSAFWVGPSNAPDSYRLVRLLGGGGEGEVWEAVLPLSDQGRRRVAVKILPGSPDPGEEAGWLHHGHLLRSLADPGLVRVTDHFLGARKHRGGTVTPEETDSGSRANIQQPVSDVTMAHGGAPFRYVVMDLVEGPTLREWIDEHPDATARERLRLLSMVAVALDAMHSGAQTEVPVAHGDVKPSNIVVVPDGGAVLVDMGLTRLADGPGGHGSSLPYAAPEIRNTGRSSVEADRFAFFATVAHALTGEVPPLRGDGLVDLDALNQRLQHAPSVAGRPALAGGLLNAMAAYPDRRPRPLRPWLSSLTDTLSGTATGPRTPAPETAVLPVGAAAARRRRLLPAALVGLLVLLLLVAGVVIATRPGSKTPVAVPTPASAETTTLQSPTDSPSPSNSPTDTPSPEVGGLPEGAIYLDSDHQVDTSSGGSPSYQPYGVSGTDYPHAVGLSSSCFSSTGGDAWVDFNLSRRYSKLTTTVGLSDKSPSTAHTTYKVIADGKTLSSGDLRLGSSVPVDVPVGNVLRVRLFTNDANVSDCSSTTTTVFGDPTATP